MIKFIYNYIIIPIASFIIKVWSLFNKKIRERERNWLPILKKIEQDLPKDAKKILFHVSSMGEFEQAKQLIKLVKENYPEIKIVCSFYSPSGYKHQKNFPYADYFCYLPFDKRKSIRYFLDVINPAITVFVRYEIWYNLLSELNKRKIPVFLICATVPKKSQLYKMKLINIFYKEAYSFFTKIYTVGQLHTDFFKNVLVLENIQTLTDTRFDLIVNKVANQTSNLLDYKEFFSDFITLVVGSSWEQDEELIKEAIQGLDEKVRKRLKLILVPHEPTNKNLTRLKQLFPKSVFLSEIEKLVESNLEYSRTVVKEQNIIVDSVGKLLGLYRLADIAYVGGGFGAGVHSLAEPASYGLPLACGPKIENAPDAPKLKDLGVLRVINKKEDLTLWLSEFICNDDLRKNIGLLAENYIKENTGSTQIIFEEIKRFI